MEKEYIVTIPKGWSYLYCHNDDLFLSNKKPVFDEIDRIFMHPIAGFKCLQAVYVDNKISLETQFSAS